MEFPQFLLIVVAITVVIVCAAWHAQAEAKRTKGLREYALRRRYRFVADEDADLPSDLPRMADTTKGHDRYAYNTMTRELDDERAAEVRAGDFHYATTSHSGKRSQTHHHNLSYAAVRLRHAAAPLVAIRREHFFDTIGAALGFDDIDFESAEFSDAFHVSSDDKRFAYDLLHPRTMELMLHASPQRLELRGEWLCATDGMKRWSPEEFDNSIDWLNAFLELWPDHLKPLTTDIARQTT
ncbi:MAG: hypothetical protein ACRCT8_18365 [Lacipirellulaceae bacterium]